MGPFENALSTSYSQIAFWVFWPASSPTGITVLGICQVKYLLLIVFDKHLGIGLFSWVNPSSGWIKSLVNGSQTGSDGDCLLGLGLCGEHRSWSPSCGYCGYRAVGFKTTITKGRKCWGHITCHKACSYRDSAIFYINALAVWVVASLWLISRVLKSWFRHLLPVFWLLLRRNGFLAALNVPFWKRSSLFNIADSTLCTFFWTLMYLGGCSRSVSEVFLHCFF